MDNKSDYIVAHDFCTGNKNQLTKDKECGCFYCLRIFSPSKITFWFKDKSGETAFCPYCGIDAIIGKSSGYPITIQFLQIMKDHWFT